MFDSRYDPSRLLKTITPIKRDRGYIGELIILPVASICFQNEAAAHVFYAAASQSAQDWNSQNANGASPPVPPDVMNNYYAVLEFAAAHGSGGLGSYSAAAGNQIKRIDSIMRQIEKVHLDTFNQQGKLAGAAFTNQRATLFRQLNTALGGIVNKTGLRGGSKSRVRLKAGPVDAHMADTGRGTGHKCARIRPTYGAGARPW